LQPFLGLLLFILILILLYFKRQKENLSNWGKYKKHHLTSDKTCKNARAVYITLIKKKRIQNNRYDMLTVIDLVPLDATGNEMPK